MLDYGKKALLLGLGTLAFSREKVEKLVDELIKKGELTICLLYTSPSPRDS